MPTEDIYTLADQIEQGMPTLVWLDNDLRAAFSNCAARPSGKIMELLATIDGANDGPDWHWLALLDNGLFAYLCGGCDYTGWG